jgi:hypothetical protein
MCFYKFVETKRIVVEKIISINLMLTQYELTSSYSWINETEILLILKILLIDMYSNDYKYQIIGTKIVGMFQNKQM